jgi:ubiquinone/menaquinone biosynthesis C-methylase UbiE
MSSPQTIGFVDPSSVVSQLALAPGSQVADFGCGSGFFSLEFAKHVGTGGVVHALDILPSSLEAVTSRAKTAGLTNIVTKRVNLEKAQGSGLMSSSMDWVILKDILLQNKQKEVIIREVVRVLKPGGHAVIMEWSPDESLVGPDKSLRVKPEDLKALVLQEKLTIERELGVGGFHYAFLVKKVVV